ncbi:MAG: hypothetical protein [Podoviridae sp. ctbj_2]|nr:MAG: hypothetical protein [Podoviridae sp. ctbj_2]
MSKVVLPPITGGYNLSRINQNFQEVADALNEGALWRDNPAGEPNEMKNVLDMNGNRIYNLPDPVLDHEAVPKGWLEDHIQGGPYKKNLRVEDVNVPALPNAVFRANKLLSFDAQGMPQVQFPSADSATQLRIDLSQGDGAGLIGYKQEGNNAIVYDLLSKVRENFSIQDYTQINDESVNTQLAFTQLETDHKGSHVDLLGRIFLVDSIPVNNDYYNGKFKIGTTYYDLNISPRLTPFHAPNATLREVEPKRRIYRGLNVGFVPLQNSSKWVTFWREASGHGVEDGTAIVAANTDDTMNTLTDHRVIYRVSTADSRNFSSGRMGAGRIGICIARPQESGSYLNPVFIYNDNSNVGTWTSVDMPASGNRDFHGEIYPWPASAGGHDTLGYITYAYRPSAEGGGIVAYRTVSNGASWSETTESVLPTVAFPNLSEMAVVRVRNENKWVMMIRTSSGGNMAISTSTNMVNWTPVQDSGLLLKGNPPAGMYADGKIWCLSFSRRNQEIIPEFGNCVVISGANADILFSSQGSVGFKGWTVVAPARAWPTGYVNIQQVRGRYYGFLTLAEEQPGNSRGRTAFLGLLSGDPIQSSNTNQALEDIPNKNYVWNGEFTDWSAGTTFNTFATRALTAPGFTFSRASFAAGAEVSRINGDKSRYALRVRRLDGDSGLQMMNLTHTFTQDDSIPFRNQVVTISFRARAGAGFSAANGFLAVQLRQTNNSAEQTITSSSGLFSTGDAPVDTSGSGRNLDGLWRDFNIVLQNVALDTTQLSLRIGYTPVGTATNDYFDIERLKIEIGRGATPFVHQDLPTVSQYTKRFYQSKTVQTENGSRHIPLQTMHKVPTVTASVGTAASITVDGFELSHSAASASNIVASAWL